MSMARSVYGTLSRIDTGLTRIERVAIFALMMFQVAILTMQVLSRYIFNNPLDYTEEASRFALIWLVFIGAAYSAYLNEHFIVQLLVDNINFPGKKIYLLFIDVVVILFFVGLIYYGIKISWNNPRIEPALNVSIGWAYLAIPVGCALAVYHLVVALIRVRLLGDERYDKYEAEYDRIPPVPTEAELRNGGRD